MFRPKPVKLEPRWDLMEGEGEQRRLRRGVAVEMPPLRFDPVDLEPPDEPEVCSDPECECCHPVETRIAHLRQCDEVPADEGTSWFYVPRTYLMEPF